MVLIELCRIEMALCIRASSCPSVLIELCRIEISFEEFQIEVMKVLIELKSIASFFLIVQY